MKFCESGSNDFGLYILYLVYHSSSVRLYYENLFSIFPEGLLKITQVNPDQMCEFQNFKNLNKSNRDIQK